MALNASGGVTIIKNEKGFNNNTITGFTLILFLVLGNRFFVTLLIITFGYNIFFFLFQVRLFYYFLLDYASLHCGMFISIIFMS